jgi:hypothetical protein
MYMRYAEVQSLRRFRKMPVHFYRSEAKLVKYFSKYPKRLVYDIWVEDSELVIEYKYPALVEYRAQLRLRGVVESEHFEEIQRLLNF